MESKLSKLKFLLLKGLLVWSAGDWVVVSASGWFEAIVMLFEPFSELSVEFPIRKTFRLEIHFINNKDLPPVTGTTLELVSGP